MGYILFYSRRPRQPKLLIDAKRAEVKLQPTIMRSALQSKRILAARKMLRMGRRGGNEIDPRRAIGPLMDLPVVLEPTRIEKVCRSQVILNEEGDLDCAEDPRLRR